MCVLFTLHRNWLCSNSNVNEIDSKSSSESITPWMYRLSLHYSGSFLQFRYGNSFDMRKSTVQHLLISPFIEINTSIVHYFPWIWLFLVPAMIHLTVFHLDWLRNGVCTFFRNSIETVSNVCFYLCPLSCHSLRLETYKVFMSETFLIFLQSPILCVSVDIVGTSEVVQASKHLSVWCLLFLP